MFYEKCMKCGSRWQRVPVRIQDPTVMSAAAPSSSPATWTATAAPSTAAHSTPFTIRSNGIGTVELVRPSCPAGHGLMVMQANSSNHGLYWGCAMATCVETFPMSMDGRDVRVIDTVMVNSSDEEDLNAIGELLECDL